MEARMGGARINYVELPVADAAVAGAFYEAAFGWTLEQHLFSFAPI